MGVDLSTWFETLARYPLKFKFEGLAKPSTTVVKAAQADEGFCEKRFDAEVQSLMSVDCVDLWLEYCQSTEGRVDLADEEARYRWACDMASDSFDFNDWDAEAPFILEEYPPEGVIDPASGDVVPLGDVYYLCPGCNRCPVYRYSARGSKSFELLNERYCGLCGCERAFEMSGEIFAEQMALDRLPFSKAETIEAYVEELRGFTKGDEVDEVDADVQAKLAAGEKYVSHEQYIYYLLDGAPRRLYIDSDRALRFGLA